MDNKRNSLATQRMETGDALNVITERVDAAYALLDTIREQCNLDGMTRDAVYGVQVLVGGIASDLRNVKEAAV